MTTPQQYLDDFVALLSYVEVTAREGGEILFDDGVAEVLSILRALHAFDGKIMLIGNGAEMSIASHLAVDLWKVGGVRALAFSDGAQLTALANDRGAESVFRDPVKMFGDVRDVVLALSCSGESPNVLAAAAVACREGYPLVTLTGFEPTNALRGMGNVNFYVPASTYGACESAHALIMHCILDCWMLRKEDE